MDFLKAKCNTMKYILMIFFVCFIYSCEQKQQATQSILQDTVKPVSPTPVIIDEDLITDTSIGKISRSTTLANLENIFGKSNIQDTINYGAEGMDSFMVTKIYSNTPKELIIHWQKNKFHSSISRIDLYQENAAYHTIDSLKIGSTLEMLLKANGKKINFSGTSWDYGGFISSYNGGKHNKSNINFRLASAEDASEKIMGDHELNTDMPLVKDNIKKIYISNISLILDKNR